MLRRDFLNMLTTTGGGLILGVQATGCVSIPAKKIRDTFEKEGLFQPNAFLCIHPKYIHSITIVHQLIVGFIFKPGLFLWRTGTTKLNPKSKLLHKLTVRQRWWCSIPSGLPPPQDQGV